MTVKSEFNSGAGIDNYLAKPNHRFDFEKYSNSAEEVKMLD